MARKIKVIDDPTAAADIAREGELPQVFAGKADCPECRHKSGVGPREGLKAPPPGTHDWPHLAANPMHHWSNRRKGRLSSDDLFGVNIPHPEDPEHHEPGGWFDTQQEHLLREPGDEEGEYRRYKAPVMDKDTVLRLLAYAGPELSKVADTGVFDDPEMNKILGVGHPDTGLDEGMPPTLADWRMPFRVGQKIKPAMGNVKPRSGEPRMRQMRGKLVRVGQSPQVDVNTRVLGSTQYPETGKMLVDMLDGPLYHEKIAKMRHDKMRDAHPHLYDAIMGGHKEGKTPCSLCAGHGTVDGNRAGVYFAAHGYGSLKTHADERQGLKQDEEWQGDEDPSKRAVRQYITVNNEATNAESDRNDINEKLSMDSAPFGGEWKTDDPFGEMLAFKDNEYLCPHCTGMGRCQTCSGEGEVHIANRELSEDDRAELHALAPRYKHAHDLMLDAPKMPWTWPWETKGEEPKAMESLLQTEPGPGQWEPRGGYIRPQEQREQRVAVRDPTPPPPTGQQPPQPTLGPMTRVTSQATQTPAQVPWQQYIEQGRYPAQIPLAGSKNAPIAELKFGAGPGGYAPSFGPGETFGDPKPIQMPGAAQTGPKPIEMPTPPHIYTHHDPNDERGFTLSPKGETPFEEYGEHAWDAYYGDQTGGKLTAAQRESAGGRVDLPKQFAPPPSEEIQYGSGMSFRPGAGFDPSRIEDAHSQELAKYKAANWENKPQEKKRTWENIKHNREQDLEEGRKHSDQMLRHSAFRAPNVLWGNHPEHMVRAALGMRGGENTPDNSDLNEIHQRGGKELGDSRVGELALMRAIRAVHPDWTPEPDIATLMPHEELVTLLNKGEPIDMAFILLKAYALETRRCARTEGIDISSASVSSLNEPPSVHLMQSPVGL